MSVLVVQYLKIHDQYLSPRLSAALTIERSAAVLRSGGWAGSGVSSLALGKPQPGLGRLQLPAARSREEQGCVLRRASGSR